MSTARSLSHLSQFSQMSHMSQLSRIAGIAIHSTRSVGGGCLARLADNGGNASHFQCYALASTSATSGQRRSFFNTIPDNEPQIICNQSSHHTQHSFPPTKTPSNNLTNQPQHNQFHTHHKYPPSKSNPSSPGSKAFGECEISALSDLFLQFAKTSNSVDSIGPYLDLPRIQRLLAAVGETPDHDTLESLFREINVHQDGKLRLDCFLRAADRILGKAPARIVLIVGGPGSGKGALCSRLEQECGVIHLSCGEMLREEVEAGTPLGKEVEEIMSRGELVSSAVVTALMRRRMRQHPGRRILLDGFPRSLENARDFVEQCGPPELALHLDCEDWVLMERILRRGGKSAREAERARANGEEVNVENVRSDDNIETAIKRLKTYHKHHESTMAWLKSIKVPIVELDCSGSKEEVWSQLMAIGRLMRPAVKIPPTAVASVATGASAAFSMGGDRAQSPNDDLQWIA